jgi:hypothetical protein
MKRLLLICWDICMTIPTITKLEAAHRQLTTAIRMFFNPASLRQEH